MRIGRSTRLRLRFAAGLSVLLLTTAAVPVLAAGSPAEQEPRASAAAPSPSEVAAVERAERERAEWLRSPEAARQREASRSAYTKLTAEEAKDLLVGSFPEAFAGLNADAARVLSELVVEEPLGTYGAKVTTTDGHSAIVESTVPVQSAKGDHGMSPLDLGLRAVAGGFEPVNPLVEVALPAESTGTVRLESGLEIELPSEGPRTARRLGEMNLIYPNTDTDTDTLISPISSGVEVFEQLRSTQSPQRLVFHLALPRGAQLRKAEEGAEVISETGDSIADVPPPTAVDAQGADVPVEMGVEGHSLVLEIDHTQRDVAYPILVDPTFEADHKESPPFAGWSEVKTNSQYLLAQSPTYLAAISKGEETNYPAETHGHWTYTAPGTGYIEHADFSGIGFYPHKSKSCEEVNQPHGYTGIWNGAGYSALEVWQGTGHNTGTDAWGASVGGTTNHTAIVGIGTGNQPKALKCAHELYVGSVVVTENDPEPPTIKSVSGVPPAGEWFKSAAVVTTVAQDSGFGIKRIAYFDGLSMQETQPSELGCDGTASSRCPSEFSYVHKPEYREGVHTLKISAQDPLGGSYHTSEWERQTKFDPTSPGLLREGL